MKISNERIEQIRASYAASKQGHASISHPLYDESIHICDELLALRAQLAELRGQEPAAFRWRMRADQDFGASEWTYLPAARAGYFIDLVGEKDPSVEYEYVYAAPVPAAASQPEVRATGGLLSDEDWRKFSAAHEALRAASQPYTVPDDAAFDAWTRSDVDLRITLESEAYMGIAKASWKACRAAMLQPSELVYFSDRCRELVGVGVLAPDFGVIASIENAIRRSNCLGLIESHMSVVVGNDETDGSPVEESLLNWGEEPAKYIETFKAALPKFCGGNSPVIPDSSSDHIPDATKLIGELTMFVKRLSWSLRRANPDSKVANQASQYLRDKGLISVSDCLRGADESEGGEA